MNNAVIFLKHKEGKMAASLALESQWGNFLRCGHDSGWGMGSLCAIPRFPKDPDG